MSNPLIFDDFISDVRVQRAKNLLLEALSDAKNKIQDIKPKDPVRIQTYTEYLNTFSGFRANPLYYPYIGSGIGNGALVELLDGSIKYDLISGIGPQYLGHSFEGLVSTAIDSALCDTIMQGNLQQNLIGVKLSELLCKLSGLDHCFLSSSGAMAGENSLKVCFQKNYPANRILAFDHAFAGRTLALSQITDKPQFRKGLPANLHIDYIPFYSESDPEGSSKKSLQALEQHIVRYPQQHAVMCIELIQGEGGFYTAPPSYFKSIIDILKKHSIGVWLDEVQSFARTEDLFCYHHYGLKKLADVVSIGKVSQVCATLFTKEYAPKPGLLSQTFTASTSALYASYFLINYALEHNFFGKQGVINRLHESFAKRLSELSRRYPNAIQGPFGIGAMIAFTVLDGSVEKVTDYLQKLFENGVIGFIAGSNPCRVRFLVPVGVLTDRDIDKIFAIIEKTLHECL